MKILMEQYGSAVIYAIAGGGMAAILLGVLYAISMQREGECVRELFEEYGEFIVEAVGSFLFLIILWNFFLGPPLKGLIAQFIASAIGQEDG